MKSNSFKIISLTTLGMFFLAKTVYAQIHTSFDDLGPFTPYTTDLTTTVIDIAHLISVILMGITLILFLFFLVRWFQAKKRLKAKTNPSQVLAQPVNADESGKLKIQIQKYQKLWIVFGSITLLVVVLRIAFDIYAKFYTGAIS